VGPRRLIRHFLSMAISGSYYSLASHCPCHHLPAVPRIRQYRPHKFLAQFHERFIMDPFQILWSLRDLTSFLDVFPSDRLPSSRPILKPCTLIVNPDPHTEGGSHWLAIRLTPRCSCAYYFDSYAIVPVVPNYPKFPKTPLYHLGI